ncbi:MAG: hypothetical protein H0W07_02530 [Chloroflexi bacterium]|nr:hypothetical protein [Chloroflexota bacterium]
MFLPLIALLVSLTGAAAAPAPAVAGAPALKLVVIVGPSGSETSRYLGIGEAFAKTGERYGMDVRRVFHPRATWSKVLANIQGAKLVIVLGHGNGWPSEYPPYQTDTKNGLGLNPYEGASSYSTKYYGEGPVSKSIRLGTNAIVLLHHMCYSAGNGQSGQSIPSEWTAKQRVDNYGAGFIKSGARAVFAYYWGQQDDFVQQLMTRQATMDQIFMTRGRGDYDGYVGGRDVRFASVRSRPYSGHLDRSNHGYIRSVVGNLGMTTAQWKAGTAPTPDPDPEPAPTPQPDRTAPKLTALSMTATPPATAADRIRGIVSPNGDGIRESLRLYHTLSENAWLDAKVETDDGTVVGRYSKWATSGRTSHLWDGRDGKGARIPDGSYWLRIRPRDAAGNLGQPATVGVRILTAMKSPAVSNAMLYPNDGDGLASSTTLSSTLRSGGELAFRITTISGQLIAEWAPGKQMRAGDYSWTWRGIDMAGNAAPTGYYRALTVVKTEAGNEWWGQTIFVGAFKIFASDTSPRRGAKVTFVIISTESLSRNPSVTITQPGVPSYTVGSQSTSARGRYVATVYLRDAGQAGMGSVRVTGIDAGDRSQSRTMELRID